MANHLQGCCKAFTDALGSTEGEDIMSTIKASPACHAFVAHCSTRLQEMAGQLQDRPVESVKLVLAQAVLAITIRGIVYRTTGWVNKTILALVMVFVWHLFLDGQV